VRVLVTLLGASGGDLVDDERSTARAAMAHLPHDRVHVLAVDPEHPELDAVRELAERAGAPVEVDPVPGEDLLAAHRAVLDAVEGHLAGDREVHVQVNAGRHANLLSTAGLLACLHASTSAHFVHEDGHDELSVVTRSPLSPLLDEDAREALAGFPAEGVPLDRADEHDPAALNRLKDEGLVERAGDRLVVTDLGASYRDHVRGRDRG
jgi:hypothetical protein